MKTATITLHSAHNNGSFLQAFALQKTINKLGYSNEIINFIPKAQYSLYQNIIFKDSTLKGVIKGGLNIPNYKSLSIRKKRFNEVLEKLNKTKMFENDKDFEEIVKKFDCLVAGSDQIWNNATMPDFTPLYFLPVDKYKISYAPSFGKSLSNQFDNTEYINNIDSFDRISVREKSAQKELNKLIPHRDIDVVLDPTFLLEKEEYQILEKNAKRKYNEDYIFFYCIKASNDVLKTVRKISKELGLPVVTVFTGVNTYKCQIFGQKVDFTAGPEEFVDYIKNAKYVISNSFHGIVFSIIYNKVFFRIADNEEGTLKIDERLDSILNLLNLESQNIVAGMEYSLNKKVDYEKPNRLLLEMKNSSIEWLDESLKSARKSL